MYASQESLDPVTQTDHGAEPVDPALIERALAHFVGDALPTLATGFCLLYLVFTGAHYLLLPAPIRLILVVCAAGTSLLSLGMALYWRRYPMISRYAHFWAASLSLLVLINSWLHLWLSRDPLQSTNLMLLVVGIGFFFLSSRWFVGFIVVVFLCWIGAIYLLDVAIDQSIHFAFGLFSAAILSTLAHLARKRTLTRLSALRLRDVKRAQNLQQALEAEQEIEAALRQSETGYRQLSIRLEEQAEALRLANDELARAAKLKDEFLANMSHELRTPLTAILGLTESLRENVYGVLSERQHAVIQNVHESGRHLLELINDILDVAKSEAGKLELELLPADARMIAEVSLRFCQQEAQKKRLEVSFDCDEQVTLFLADERRMKQILVNLLSNAVKFTAEGGRMGLRLEGDMANDIVRYCVWDTGIGVAREQMPRLFKPFIQLDSRLARRYEGSGLGLALVYRMVEMHGGSITLQSSPGEGSEFIVALPWRKMPLRSATNGAIVLHSAEPQGDEDRPETVAKGSVDRHRTTVTNGRPSLLIVDDQGTTHTWIADLATAEGYDALPTSNPSDALRLAAEVPPHLIFVDLQMNDCDAFDLIRTLSNEEQVNARPVIAMSALALPDEAEQAKAAGASHYFAKPLGRATFRTILNTYASPAKERLVGPHPQSSASRA